MADETEARWYVLEAMKQDVGHREREDRLRVAQVFAALRLADALDRHAEALKGARRRGVEYMNGTGDE